MTTLATSSSASSTPTNPGMAEAAADLRDRITVEAIRAFEAARALDEEASDLAEIDPTLARWHVFQGAALDDAERTLLGAILTADEAIEPDEVPEAVYSWHPARAVESDHRLYVAIPNPKLEPGQDDEGNQVMRIAVLDRQLVATLPI